MSSYTYTPSKKNWSKRYYDNNKEHILEVRKEWYDRNKETIKEKRNEKIKCDCGLMIRKGSQYEHYKTIKHQEHLTFIENQKKLINSINSFLNKNI